MRVSPVSPLRRAGWRNPPCVSWAIRPAEVCHGSGPAETAPGDPGQRPAANRAACRQRVPRSFTALPARVEPVLARCAVAAVPGGLPVRAASPAEPGELFRSATDET